MAVVVVREGQDVYRIAMSGVFRRADLERCEDRIATHLDRGGSVRLLFVLDRFDGWDRSDDWDDVSFFASYGDRIDRIAIVGDERWRTEALMFAGAGLRRAPVEFFAASAGDASAARAWLTA